jgi:DNA repair protein RadC
MASSARMKDLPANARPRERLARLGAGALSETELIAVLLRTGVQGMNVLHVAGQILARFPKLNALALATVQDLRQIKGVGRDKAVTLQAAFELAKRMARELQGDSPLLETPEQVADFLREENRSHNVEHFQVVLLNARRRLIRVENIAKGLLDTIVVHPREVFRAAIRANAAAIIMVHNHPSGDPTPSEADIKVTRDLIRAGQLLKIEVLDHVILGRKTPERPKDYASLRELGYFYT